MATFTRHRYQPSCGDLWITHWFNRRLGIFYGALVVATQFRAMAKCSCTTHCSDIGVGCGTALCRDGRVFDTDTTCFDYGDGGHARYYFSTPFSAQSYLGIVTTGGTDLRSFSGFVGRVLVILCGGGRHFILPW